MGSPMSIINKFAQSFLKKDHQGRLFLCFYNRRYPVLDKEIDSVKGIFNTYLRKYFWLLGVSVGLGLLILSIFHQLFLSLILIFLILLTVYFVDKKLQFQFNAKMNQLNIVGEKLKFKERIAFQVQTFSYPSLIGRLIVFSCFLLLVFFQPKMDLFGIIILVFFAILWLYFLYLLFLKVSSLDKRH